MASAAAVLANKAAATAAALAVVVDDKTNAGVGCPHRTCSLQGVRVSVPHVEEGFRSTKFSLRHRPIETTCQPPSHIENMPSIHVQSRHATFPASRPVPFSGASCRCCGGVLLLQHHRLHVCRHGCRRPQSWPSGRQPRHCCSCCRGRQSNGGDKQAHCQLGQVTETASLASHLARQPAYHPPGRLCCWWRRRGAPR